MSAEHPAATLQAPDPRLLAPARRILRDTFGYAEFLPGQPEVIAAVLAGRDTLAVMPTGGGKSLCYQVPALLFGYRLVVVVSPLLALMKDQVDALHQAGVAAASVNSTMPREAQMAVMDEAIAGRLRLLYVAPERFGDGAFMAALRRTDVALLAVDEAHCISQWGHDFRPSYRDLGGVRPRLGSPPILALTATADPLVRDDIVARLQLRDAAVHVAGFDRPNLRFTVVRVKNQKEKAEQIATRLRELGGTESAIVYCGTRRKVEELTDFLQRQRLRAARYHAGMEDADRQRIQDAFARDSLRIIVATNAFGMGIDKPDVRMVIHNDLPDSLESYYQEAGRAGRDGAPAECTLFYTPRDRSLREFFIEQAHPPAATVVRVYRSLAEAAGANVHIRDLMLTDGEPGINAAVQALEDSGLARRRGQVASATRPNAQDSIDLEGLEAHREHALKKLDAMQRYAESATCLRARILDYFGDAGRGRPCQNCGPCLAPPARLRPAEEGGGELFQALRAVRRRIAEQENVPPYVVFSDATLHEMAARRPRTRAELLGIGGVGQQKLERYGEAFLEACRAARTPEPSLPTSAQAEPPSPVAYRGRLGRPIADTVRRTWELHRSGLDLQAIGAQRGLSTSTIANHLAELVLRGEITDVSPWLDDLALARIRRAAGPGPVAALGPLKEALGDAVTYEQLHFARAVINRESGAD